MNRLVGAVTLVALVLTAAPARGLTPAELSAKLAPEAGWASHVRAAREAEAAGDPELIPAMFAGFVAAKRGTLREDPDIHERLLIALEQWPAPEVARRLEEAPAPPELAPVGVERYHRWLRAVAADARGFRSLRVVQGDALNVLFGGGDALLPPAPDVAVPGGDADTSSPVGSFVVPSDRLPPGPGALWPRVLVALLVALVGLVVLAGRVRAARRFVFPLLAVLIAPASLVGLEVALTAAGVEPLAAVRPNFNLGGGEAGARWFEPVPGDDSRLRMVKNNAREQRFLLRHDGVRVVALGGSSVRGKGDLVEYSWPSVLERRLRACAPPGVAVDVVNAGADGALSDDLVGVVRRLAEASPDVLVVYAGYNDFVFVPLLTRFEGYSSERMGLRHLLGRTRVGHVGARLTGRLGPADRAGPSQASGPVAAPTDAQVADMRGLLANNLAWNLDRIARFGAEMDAEVVFVTQGQNEDLCGVGSLNGQADWDRACFPADARRTILQAASAGDVTVVDAAAALRADAGGETVGWSHFWDEIHPGRRGSAVIGESVGAALIDVLWPGEARECDMPLPAR